MSAKNQSLAGKKLLLLDGSRKAIEIVEQAQALGVQVAVTDFNTPEQSPAKLAADEHFDVSTADIAAVVSLIEQEGIDGVLPGFSDRWLPTYGEICQRAGLPAYGTPAQLRLFTDKQAYKELLGQYGVPVIEGFTIAEARAGQVPPGAFPVMVKPSDGSGSRGITICRDADDLERGLEAALDYSWTGDVVIERYQPGREATAYWVFQDGEYYVATVANRHMTDLPGGAGRLPVAYSHPSDVVPRYMEEVAPRVGAALRETGVRNGIMFMQGIIDDGVFRTYDLGFRPTPTQEYKVLEVLCGYNPLAMLITFAVTGSMGEPDLEQKANPVFDGYGINVSTLMMPGTVGEFVGLEEAAELEGAISVSTSLAPGDSLPPESLGQLRQIAVRTIGVANTAQGADDLVQAVGETIRVRSSEGSTLSLPGLSPGEVVRSVL